ncbi:MAG: RNA 2'-phosphotransferase [Agriterribacter sp.]
MKTDLKHISKFISLVLRHNPAAIGLRLDENGWADVEELIQKLNDHNNTQLNIVLLEEIVVTNDKKRFSFNTDKTKIRANQGHSLAVELNLKAAEPPDILYHGTAIQFLAGILEKGLQKQSRQHVHLSSTEETAKAVGGRHGKPVILSIKAKEMFKAGFVFFLSDNNVWLTDHVPFEYICLH